MNDSLILTVQELDSISFFVQEVEKMNSLDEEHGILQLDDIASACNKVLSDYNVEFCYLFGSYAKGKALYTNLLTSGRLNTYLTDINQQAEEQMLLLTKQMAEREGVTEQLKAQDQIKLQIAVGSSRFRDII